MYGTFWALVPPFLAIILALVTKEVFTSLFAGILVGALFATSGNIIKTMDLIVVDGLSGAVADGAGNFCFLVILGILVAMINKSGGSAAFGRWAETHIKTRAGAQIATFILGVLIFIDDYFNCLTVGSVMRPVTDRHNISRAKLAFLIDATAAPVCMIAPISSWAAAVSGVADDLGTGITGIQLFLRAIPYNYYSILTLVFIVTIVFMKFDYGPMSLAEASARLNGDLGAQTGDDTEAGNPRGRIIDLILPVVVLVVVVF
ncbi:MAG: Na+/H+ antiporter NhaC family protein, partial [Oscillospiraceae bacterium]|nr:Na+/H+ antiporter NhaC family protein [Oscillospiraceae bacterium]